MTQPDSLESVFVYGTLRPPGPATPPEDTRFFPLVASAIRSQSAATLSDADLYDLGAYPGARPGEGVIYGDLLSVDPAALAEFDRIEGHPNFFRRDRVRVQNADGEIEAWIYWAPAGLVDGRARIEGGDWFQREGVGRAATLANSEPADPKLAGLVARFADEECCWLGSVRPDGRPHSAPVWHVWHEGRVYVVTTRGAVKTTNIAANPAVVITHPDPLNPIIIEGWATETGFRREELHPLFLDKYQWDIATDEEYDTILEIVPTRFLAWGKYGDGRWTGAEIMRASGRHPDDHS
ncbi:MAG: gamma-glutamylcyclotransferase [Caldilineales bacterium]|nr:gamma-glutamylcyclotransferase [Caldilineales bacterium]